MTISEHPGSRHDIASPRCRRQKSKYRFGKSPQPLKTISTKRIEDFIVANGRTYRLNCPLILTVLEGGSGVHLWPSDLRRDAGELRASAPTLPQALSDFGRRFDRWVQTHWRVPPHLRTPEDLRVIYILERIVNWERFDADNPVVQPMWGRVVERLPSGSIRIFWMIGPHEAEQEEVVLPKRDVVPALTEIDPGQWFYGTAKCYTDHVKWIEQPEKVPAYDDASAREGLWSSLPTEIANEPDCWPLKKP